ncbi:MAG TPA: cytochrome c oxidase assembly protein [Solirubrobacteraceae bacterium]|nr:cytochrome c oxidase assembly protein [Solirubrobacteraceae bacterium]
MGWLTRHWSWDPSLIYVAVAALLYVLGGMRRGTSRNRMRKTGDERLRELAFVAGLVSIVIALDSPIDYYSDLLFWVHMGQHIILLTVAPPLILLGRPWPRMWQALPLDIRTRTGRTLAGAAWTAPIRAIARPVPAWILFNGNLLLWHVPGAYNLTLSHQWIHDCEHALFFFTGLLFWAHVVDPGPLRQRLSWYWRAIYVTGAMITGWVLAIVLVLAKEPLYQHYLDLSTRPGGISALTDQQIAGGMMWVPGSAVYSLTLLAIFSRWASPDSESSGRRRSTGADPRLSAS